MSHFKRKKVWSVKEQDLGVNVCIFSLIYFIFQNCSKALVTNFNKCLPLINKVF